MPRKVKLLFLPIIILIGAVCYFLSPLSSKPPTHFPDMISSFLAPNPKWTIDAPTPSEEKNLHSILSQKFTILGQGQQAIACQSEDGKYIVKFFQMYRYKPSLKHYLSPFFERKRLQTIQLLFDGYKNGYEDFRKEAGLIWIHFNKTTFLNKKIAVIDLHGKEHLIDADSTDFVIQEKAEEIFKHLSRLYKEGKFSEAEQDINAFYAFIQARADKGYTDRDKMVGPNYGFVGNRPIQMDIGQLYKMRNRKVRPKDKQLVHIRQHVEKWKSEQQLRTSGLQ